MNTAVARVDRLLPVELVASFKRSISALARVRWPASFVTGLRMVVNNLKDVERLAAGKEELDRELLFALLPVIDGIERARRQKLDPFRSRLLTNVLNALASSLQRAGAEPDLPMGSEFDPHIHDAIAVRALSGVPSGTVVDMMERGWSLDGQMMRPSKVIVS